MHLTVLNIAFQNNSLALYNVLHQLNDVTSHSSGLTSHSSGLTLAGKQTQQMEYSIYDTDKARRTATSRPLAGEWHARTHTHAHTDFCSLPVN